MSHEKTWINPLGGLGDALMLSSILKQVIDHRPDQKFHLVRRTKYLPFLKNHPAIVTVGHPSRGTKKIIGTDYWSTEGYAQGGRAFQCLAEKLDLSLPVEETLWLPQVNELQFEWPSSAPPHPHVVFSAGTDSPRKLWPLDRWAELAKKLKTKGFSVIQTGRLEEPHIPGTFSLLGLTTPTQLIALLKKTELLISPDSFAMHAAKLVGTPAIILWGPTLARVYGYKGHHHVSSETTCPSACIGPNQGKLYSMPCTNSTPCMANISVQKVLDVANCI